MAKVGTTSEEKTLDLELIHDAASEIEADSQEMLRAAEALPEEQAHVVIGKTEKLQEIVAEIQTDLSELSPKSQLHTLLANRAPEKGASNLQGRSSLEDLNIFGQFQMRS